MRIDANIKDEVDTERKTFCIAKIFACRILYIWWRQGNEIRLGRMFKNQQFCTQAQSHIFLIIYPFKKLNTQKSLKKLRFGLCFRVGGQDTEKKLQYLLYCTVYKTSIYTTIRDHSFYLIPNAIYSQ